MPGLPHGSRFVGTWCWIGVLTITATTAFGQPDAAPAAHAQVTDVQIAGDGTVVGRVVNRQGRPVANSRLWISSDQQVQEVQTDGQGRFRLQNVRGGMYVVDVGDSRQVVRLWVGDTAPASAVPQLTVVQGNVVRGQFVPAPARGLYDGAVLRTLTNPWIISGGVAAAIAIPLALDQDDAS